MSKKHMGLHKAHDHGAGMRANAAALMPEIANMMSGAGGGGGGAPPPPAAAGAPDMPQMPQGMPQPGMKKGGAACFKKGGPVKMAIGGAAKIRKGEMSKSGAPMPPKVKFKATSGRGSK